MPKLNKYNSNNNSLFNNNKYTIIDILKVKIIDKFQPLQNNNHQPIKIKNSKDNINKVKPATITIHKHNKILLRLNNNSYLLQIKNIILCTN